MSEIDLKYIRGEISPLQYIDTVLGECDLFEISDGCDGLRQSITRTLKEAFLRLDSLDRDHAFWKPGNGLPTLSKIGEYSKLQFKNGNEIAFWSWVEICLSYLYFANFLYQNLWVANERVNLQWLIRTSWNYHYYAGSESVEGLGEVLKALNMAGEANAKLEEVAKLNQEASNWVQNVRSKLARP